jgi:hypothetical protein
VIAGILNRNGLKTGNGNHGQRLTGGLDGAGDRRVLVQ